MRVVATILASLLFITAALSATRPIFEDTPSGINKYMQPPLLANGTPPQHSISCCGKADAYWADDFEVDGDQYVAIITDTRDDNLLVDESGNKRIHLAPGTHIVIPNERIITFPPQPPNTTGHGWVWVHVYEDEETGSITGRSVLCYLAPSGG